MPTYLYVCGSCRRGYEFRHPMAETDWPTYCDCLAEMARRPLGGAAFALKGERLRGTPLRREFVANNRDGSQTVYRTVEQAYRAELERTGSARTAAHNVRHLRRMGYVEGTPQARLARALDEAPGGRVGSSVVT